MQDNLMTTFKKTVWNFFVKMIETPVVQVMQRIDKV